MKKIHYLLLGLLLTTAVACKGNENTSKNSTNVLSSVSSSVELSLPSSSESSFSSPISSSSSSSTYEEVEGLKGDGSEKNPYLISSKAELEYLANYANGLATNISIEIDKAPHYKLTKNIDLGGMEWTPIGVDENHVFTAYIDGNGYKISNYKIVTRVDKDLRAYGLFGIFNGYIKNLTVDNFVIDITNTRGYKAPMIGGLVGYSYIGQYEACHTMGEIYYNDINNMGAMVGGLIGFDYVTNNVAVSRNFCSSNVTIEVLDLGSYAGGLFGYNCSEGKGVISISSSFTKGSLLAGTLAGGISGFIDNYCTIGKSYSLMNVETSNKEFALSAGICAVTNYESAIYDCFYAGEEVFAPSGEENSVDFIVASLAYDDHSSNILGTLTYRNAALDTSKLIFGNEEIESDETLYPQASFNDKNFLINNLHVDTYAFNVNNGEYPTLKAYEDINNLRDVNILLDREVNKHKAYYYSPVSKTYSLSGYTFAGWYYDEDFEHRYRFYTPHYDDKELYAKVCDNSAVVGVYKGSEVRNGLIMLTEDNKFTWYYQDSSYGVGHYESHGSYIYFDVEATLGNGGWSLTYASYSNGTLTFDDSSYTTYTYKFTKTDIFAGYFTTDSNMRLFFDGRGKCSYYDGNNFYDYSYTTSGSSIILKGENPYTITISYDSTNKLTKFLNVVINGTTIRFNRSNGELDYSNKPYINKTYHSVFLNAELHGGESKDITFLPNGTAITRKRYLSNYYVNEETADSVKVVEVNDEYLEFKVADYYVYRIKKIDNNYYLYYDYIGFEAGDEFALLTKTDNSDSLLGSYKGENIYYSGDYYFDLNLDSENASNSYFIQWCEYNLTCTYSVVDGNKFEIDSLNMSLRGTLTYDETKNIIYGTPTNGNFSIWSEEEFVGLFNVNSYTIFAFEEHAYYYNSSHEVYELGYEGSFTNGSEVTFTLDGVTKTYSVKSNYKTFNLIEK